MDSDWVGVYCTPDRNIQIDRNATVEDLLYVINQLSKELEEWRNKALLRPFPGDRFQ